MAMGKGHTGQRIRDRRQKAHSPGAKTSARSQSPTADSFRNVNMPKKQIRAAEAGLPFE